MSAAPSKPNRLAHVAALVRATGVEFSQRCLHGAPRPVTAEFARIEVPR